MIFFPPHFIPSRVELSMPRQPSTNYFPFPGALRDKPKQLSSAATTGSLKLIYSNYPFNNILEPCHPSTTSVDDVLAVTGYSAGLDWYLNIISCDHLPFEIPDDHVLWSRCNYRQRWNEYVMSGAFTRLYKCVDFGKPENGSTKATCSFEITIKPQLLGEVS